ncbi:MAG: type II toxin-antitoxin system VapC family toxin [Oceanicaulis sp.]
MIAVDTSALMAFLLEEPESGAVYAALVSADGLLISAGTVAEALIVSDRRGLGEQMRALFEDLGMEISPVNVAVAADVARAYQRLGKGVHPAGLNFGDCFSYALAAARGVPLLCTGGDFTQTDIELAIRP